MIHRETLWTTSKIWNTLKTSWNTLKTLWNITKHSPFDATTSALTRSFWRYRCGVSGDIADCGVGITPQMCNRVTNHGDMATFSKPVPGVILSVKLLIADQWQYRVCCTRADVIRCILLMVTYTVFASASYMRCSGGTSAHVLPCTCTQVFSQTPTHGNSNDEII